MRTRRPLSAKAMANGNDDDDREEYLGVSRSSRRNQPRVDLSKLEVPTLKKYRRVFKLNGNVESKEELVPAVARHFAQQVVDEDDILLNFAFSLKKQYLARRGLLPAKAKGKSSGKGKK
ncbi:SAP30_Sin3_bdg domain-containing protein [Chloropicon roscoffensis]|uniref:SAP30_Sin3_bdg domain-containing protein n=1 Tax=Chloropicon roscoffensis TaxID=1461544 RepID=A0A7S3CC43_9CHLO|mmetsp:Transcript_5022/g.15229  ORF Transcript_5022/g.15229 Transcript_5022/m.15229 type:complete len:119 (+) Transcript_5022:246-602(+)